MWRENFAALDGQQIHVLSYGRLAARASDAMRGVFDFLGAAPAPPRSRRVPATRKPLWQKVTNYQQLVDLGIPAAATLELPPADLWRRQESPPTVPCAGSLRPPAARPGPSASDEPNPPGFASEPDQRRRAG
jgi:hypothetical protein